MSFFAKYPATGGGGGAGVTSLDGITGAITLVPGAGISITDFGQTITIASTKSYGNLTDVGTDGITITGGTGAVVGSGTSISQHVADSTHNGYLSSTDWSTFNAKQSALTIGNITDAGTDGIVITGGTGAVIGSGVSLAQHVADATHNGYLSSADWSTFNGKQAAGNYITALTGDGTAAGPGSVALTLATVNSNVGSFGSSTAIPSFTVNGKGLVTAASTNVVIAPAGTLTGTTLAANVVTSSLTTIGTIISGVWNGTTIAIANGGTGQTSAAAAFNALAPATAKGGVIVGSGANAYANLVAGTDGFVLTANSAATNGADWEVAQTANNPTELVNVGLSVTAGSNILTIALKQADGSTNPSTGSAAVKIAMRSSTATSGAYNLRSITGALSQTLTQGTTLGGPASQNNYVWLYLIDSDGAGTMKLGASAVKLDENSLQSTVAESFSATATNASPAVFTANGHGMSNGDAVQLTGTPPTGFSTATKYYVVSKAANTFQLSASPAGTSINSSSTGSAIVVHIASPRLVSDAVYTSMPIRLIGRSQFNLATAGNWSAPGEVCVGNAPRFQETISAKIYGTAGGSYTNTNTTKTPYNSLQYDTHGMMNLATNNVIVPLAGWYKIDGGTGISGGTAAVTSQLVSLGAFANGSEPNGGRMVMVAGENTSAASTVNGIGSTTLYLNQYDVVDLRTTANFTSGTLLFQTNANIAYFSITKIGDSLG